MVPAGKLIVIGGAVDTGSFAEKHFDQNKVNLNFFEDGILRRIIRESSKGESSIIEVITTASQLPEEVGNEYLKAFQYLGVKEIHIMDISSREQANSPEMLERLKVADVVMFSGGDQLRLTSIFGGTEFLKILTKRYDTEDFLIAGTSAGAAAVSENMIYQGSSSEALLKGEVKITGGLSLIGDVIIDTHFVQRGRIGRLFQVVVSNPGILGIGLGEDTGLLIANGTEMEAIGSGLVILVDGTHIKDTNITDVDLGAPISIENLIVHVMALGDQYNLTHRKLQINKKRKEKNNKENYARIDR